MIKTAGLIDAIVGLIVSLREIWELLPA